MATLREIKTIEIPILLTKDKFDDGSDAFLLTCRPLSIYIQSKDEGQARGEFEEALKLLFKHLIESKKIIRFLKERNLIHSDKVWIGKSMEEIDELKKLEEKIKNFTLKMDKIQLGNFSKAEIALQAA